MEQCLLKVKPVGGVGQIGSNMTLLEFKNHRILIDAGILFPFEDFFDIDYLIPDLSLIESLDSLVITHGHEDHIGAVFNIITKFPQIKIYAPRFAAALIRKKLEYNKISHPITVYLDNETLNFDGLTIDPIHVNHSIPDTKGLFLKIESASFGMFFASDFKIDFNNPYEAPFDFEKLKKLSNGLTRKLLFADSTNIQSSSQNTPSENDLIPSFEKIISEATGRIFITLFSSNVHRLHTILALAEKYQFKLIPHGRSMISYIQSATEEGILPDFEKVTKRAESTKNNEENVIVLLSGCQGDFMGTFRRVVIGEDSTFKPRATDTFIISSKAIPGNEKKINFLMNKIAEIGATIFTSSDLPLHVSGHPGKKDLTRLYNEYMPTDIIPIHGEVHFLREHIKHIKLVAPYARAHFVLNHDELFISKSLDLKFIQGSKLEPIIYHGKHITIEKEKISERRKMACNGVVFLSLRLDSSKGAISNYDYNLIGLPKSCTDNKEHYVKFLENEFSKSNFKEIEKAKEELRISIRRYFDNQLGYKPTTVVHVL